MTLARTGHCAEMAGVGDAPGVGAPVRSAHAQCAHGTPGITHGTPGITHGTPGITHDTPGITHDTPGITHDTPGLTRDTLRLPALEPGVRRHL